MPYHVENTPNYVMQQNSCVVSQFLCNRPVTAACNRLVPYRGNRAAQPLFGPASPLDHGFTRSQKPGPDGSPPKVFLRYRRTHELGLARATLRKPFLRPRHNPFPEKQLGQRRWLPAGDSRGMLRRCPTLRQGDRPLRPAPLSALPATRPRSSDRSRALRRRPFRPRGARARQFAANAPARAGRYNRAPIARFRARRGSAGRPRGR